MARMVVTCPESAHLAELEVDAHPLGILILACSHFTPACAVTCARTCAARLDKKHGTFAEEELTAPGDGDDDFDPIERLKRAWASADDVEVHIETDLADLDLA